MLWEKSGQVPEDYRRKCPVSNGERFRSYDTESVPTTGPKIKVDLKGGDPSKLKVGVSVKGPRDKTRGWMSNEVLVFLKVQVGGRVRSLCFWAPVIRKLDHLRYQKTWSHSGRIFCGSTVNESFDDSRFCSGRPLLSPSGTTSRFRQFCRSKFPSVLTPSQSVFFVVFHILSRWRKPCCDRRNRPGSLPSGGREHRLASRSVCLKFLVLWPQKSQSRTSGKYKNGDSLKTYVIVFLESM